MTSRGPHQSNLSIQVQLLDHYPGFSHDLGLLAFSNGLGHMTGHLCRVWRSYLVMLAAIARMTSV